MKEIIKRVCSDENIKNGLLLIDTPTGSGKTYNAINYIVENYIELSNKGHKIFYLTPLKKNLPTEELKKLIREKGGNEEDVLFIDSITDSIINNFKNVSSEIKNEFKNSSLVEDILYAIDRLSGKNVDQIVVKEYRERIINIYYPKIKEKIKSLLSETKSKKDRLNLCRGKYSWISKLFPFYRTSEAKILLMSVDKFLVQNTTFIEASYNFINNKITDSAIIFFDEFDSCKSTILNSYIKETDKNVIDTLNFITNIHSRLQGDGSNSFSKELTEPSEKLKNEITQYSKKKTPDEIIKLIKEKETKIYEDFNLLYNYKTADDNNDNSTNFIFNDLSNMNIFSNYKSKTLLIKQNDLKKINEICFDNKIVEEDNDFNLYNLLSSIKGFNKYFSNSIKFISENYYNKVRTDPTFSLQNAIHTTLDEFKIFSNERNYIKELILKEMNVKTNNILDMFDRSVFQEGFRYYKLQDNSNHNTRTKIYMYDYNQTPEKYLLHLAKRAKIVGLSATALNDSVTGNFYIEYLKDNLKDNFFNVNDEENERLRQNFENNNIGYKKINIEVNRIDIEEKPDEEKINQYLKEIYENDEKYVGDVLNFFDMNKISEYNSYRYIKILNVIKNFILDKDIMSFLCLTSKKPDTNPNFEFNFLETQFKNICNKYNVKNTFIKLLDGSLEKFETNKQEISDELKKGSRVFVMSTYATVGAGQNLQYDIPVQLKDNLIDISKKSYDNTKKDYDGIYLDKPANVFNTLSGERINDYDLAFLLYDYEYLQASGEMSALDTKNNIKNDFYNFHQHLRLI